MKTKIQSKVKEMTLSGLETSPGIAIGEVFLFRPLKINLNELLTQVEDLEKEALNFQRAIRKVARQLDIAKRASQEQYGSQFNDIFESQKAFLEDPVLLQEIHKEIEISGNSAAFVVSKILAEKTDYFINMENTYFRERAYDIMDLKHKLIHALLGIDNDYNLSRPSIVVANMLSPSDTVQFNRNFILGFLTDKGGRTSHAAIMARGLQIPAVVNGQQLSQLIAPDSSVILDGFNGNIILNPTPETIEKYQNLQTEYDEFVLNLKKNAQLPSVTKDGRAIKLMANIEFVHEWGDAKEHHAQGVGLFRTESIFIEKKRLPTEDEQFQLYRQLAEQAVPHPVTIRTIDLGGDKLVENYSPDDELNPFLGWRAIRFCLDEPEIFKTQLRAILRAGKFGLIHILLPMVSSVEEVQQTKRIIEQAKEELRSENIPFEDNMPLGIMIETPAAAILAEIFAEYVDFFSIGTNDLTQYILAIDRTNDKVSKSYNTFNPAVLAFIEGTLRAAKKFNKPVSICGEYAATPHAIPLLLGMGFTELSMNPHALDKSKQIIRSFDVSDCEALYKSIQNMHTAQEIEKTCKTFVKSNVTDLKFFS